MIEINQTIKYILKHPTKSHKLEVVFADERMMDDWVPHLNKFEDYLIQVALQSKKSVSVV